MANKSNPRTSLRKPFAFDAYTLQSRSGAMLAQARSRTSTRECACMRTNLRLRLGAISTAETRGWRSGQRREACCCQRCWARVDGERVEDALHVCFQCPSVRERLREQGWAGPPGAVTNFHQIYPAEQRWDALAFVDSVRHF